MTKLKQALINRLMEGDELAFEEVYQHYQKLVYYMAITHLKSASEAEDIVQEVFVDVFKNKHKIKTPQSLTIWVNKIAYSRCMDALRKKKEPYSTNFEDEIETIENKSIDADVMEVINRKYVNEVIQKCLLEMSEELKMVGLLRFYEEMPLQDISEVLEIPVGTVKSRLHTVKEQLQKKLKNYGFNKVTCIAFLMPSNLKYLYETLQSPIQTEIVKPQRFAKGIAKCIILSSGVVALCASVIYIKEGEPQKVANDSSYNVVYNTKYTNQNIEIEVEPKDYDFIQINGKPTTTINENGTYTIQISKDKKIIKKQTIEIHTIDKTSPEVIHYQQEKETIVLKLKDEGAGIDESSIEIIDSNQTSISYIFQKDLQRISFQSQENQVYQVYVKDLAGNVLNATCHYQ